MSTAMSRIGGNPFMGSFLEMMQGCIHPETKVFRPLSVTWPHYKNPAPKLSVADKRTDADRAAGKKACFGSRTEAEVAAALAAGEGSHAPRHANPVLFHNSYDENGSVAAPAGEVRMWGMEAQRECAESIEMLREDVDILVDGGGVSWLKRDRLSDKAVRRIAEANGHTMVSGAPTLLPMTKARRPDPLHVLLNELKKRFEQLDNIRSQ
jgi:hypothetical protein